MAVLKPEGYINRDSGNNTDCATNDKQEAAILFDRLSWQFACSLRRTVLAFRGLLARKKSPLAFCQALREMKLRVPASVSKTIVVQHRERILNRSWKVAWFGWACDAGDRAQILVDGPQIMVR